MYKKRFQTIGLLTSVLCTSIAFGGPSGNPASTGYVDKAVATAIANLRTELTTQFNSKTTELTNLINQLPIVTHHIGEIFHGGIVFYVDESQQHGLMVSLEDIEQGIEWRNGEGGDRTTNAQAQGLGAGETNTRLIIAEQTIDQQEGRFAALIAANYQISADGRSPCTAPLSVASPCYSGWYLPSVYELSLLYANLKNALSNTSYWSSTETSTTEAYMMDFGSGLALIKEKSTPASVRAIHAF